IPGKGVQVVVDGQTVWAGNGPMLRAMAGPDAQMPAGVVAVEEVGRTAVLVGRGADVLGFIVCSDMPRPECREAIAALHAAGIAEVILLTGDNRVTAETVAREVGIDTVRAELLPEDKLAAIQELKARHGMIAMIGD